jgi:hypothetical protein
MSKFENAEWCDKCGEPTSRSMRGAQVWWPHTCQPLWHDLVWLAAGVVLFLYAVLA